MLEEVAVELIELLCGVLEEVVVELIELLCGLLEEVVELDVLLEEVVVELVELDELLLDELVDVLDVCGSLEEPPDALPLSDVPVLSELLTLSDALSSGTLFCPVTEDEISEGSSRLSGTGPQPVISKQARIKDNVFFIYCPFASLFFNYT